MSEVYESIMSGLEEAVTLKQVTEIFKGIPAKRVLELAAAEREGRVVVLDTVFQAKNGRYMIVYYNLAGWLMGRDFDTHEAAEAALAGKEDETHE